MKIVVLDGYTLNPGDLSWSGLEALGEITVHDRTAPADIAARIAGAEVVFTNKTPLARDTLLAAKSLRYVGVLATGFNVVDVAAAKEAGIAVTNIPTYGTDAVAQFAFALLLEVCHHVGEHGASVAAGEWQRSADWCYWKHPLMELAGKTMGIVGYGRIGQKTARIAEAFGMKVLAHDEKTDPAWLTPGTRYATLDELYAQSDVISLHCPLTESNRGMVGKASLRRMKDGVIILNTSRGPLVDEAALAAALASGKVRAAGLDVVSTEPIKADNPLLKAPNVIMTPHIAWAPLESRARLMDIAVGNLRSFLAGSPVNVVNR